MAEIFVAKVSGLPGWEKIVVVKRILPQLATNQEFIQMFLDEARIAATLHHPNIVQMYDIGAVDGNYFLSMEYLHGEDVRAMMKTLRSKGEGLPLEHALNVISGLAAGLHYAHEKVGFDGKELGIVHRDVNPQNVFITYDGTVKIVDFGIAKATNRFNETRYGTLKGKIPYMSPEQCRSEPLDRRSDVFAIGIMLYELTTGYRLYKGRSEFEILKKIVEEGVSPPSSLRPGYPKDLERIVLKALAKDKGERYQTAQAMQADIEAFARQHRLNISSIALSGFMQKVFGKKIEAWREAQAAGKDLAEHIAEQLPVDTSLPGAEQVLTDEDLEEVRQSTTPTPAARGELTPVAPAGRRRWAAAIGVVVVAAGAAVGFAVWKQRQKSVDRQGEVAAAGGSREGGSGEPLSESRGIGPPTQAGAGGRSGGGEGATGGEGAGEGPGGAGGTTGAGEGGTAPGDAKSAGPMIEGLSATDGAEAAVGALKVTTKPAGAHVSVDGKEVKDRAPSLIEKLAAGEHAVKVELSGHETVRTRVKIVPGETFALNLELKAKGAKAALAATQAPAPLNVPDGELRIASTPSCEVIVDGKAKGSTPLVGLKLPPGNHTVQLVNSRFGIDRSFTVEVRSGEVTKKKYDFPVPSN